MICNSCQKLIDVDKFDLHESTCKKHQTQCPKCGIQMGKSQLESHNLEVHSLKPCNYCEKVFELIDFNNHECSNPPVVCEYCEAVLPSNQFKQHFDNCSNRTSLCAKCEKYVLEKDWKSHLLLPNCSEQNLNVLRDTLQALSYGLNYSGMPPPPNEFGLLFPGQNNYLGNYSISNEDAAISIEELNPGVAEPPVKAKLITALSGFLNESRRNLGIQKRKVEYVFNLN